MQVSVWFHRSIGRDAALIAAIRNVAQEFGPHVKWIGQYTGVHARLLSWYQAFSFAAKMAVLLRKLGAETVDYVRIDLKNDVKVSTREETEISIRRVAERRRAERDAQDHEG